MRNILHLGGCMYVSQFSTNLCCHVWHQASRLKGRSTLHWWDSVVYTSRESCRLHGRSGASNCGGDEKLRPALQIAGDRQAGLLCFGPSSAAVRCPSLSTCLPDKLCSVKEDFAAGSNPVEPLPFLAHQARHDPQRTPSPSPAPPASRLPPHPAGQRSDLRAHAPAFLPLQQRPPSAIRRPGPADFHPTPPTVVNERALPVKPAPPPPTDRQLRLPLQGCHSHPADHPVRHLRADIHTYHAELHI